MEGSISDVPKIKTKALDNPLKKRTTIKKVILS